MARDDDSDGGPVFAAGLVQPIQGLRAVAALMVVWFHAVAQLPGLRDRVPWEFGGAGVDLFFVISGYIMTRTRAGTSPAAFMRRRLERIVPLYWLITALVVLAALAMPALYRSTVVEPSHVLKSLFFIPHDSPGHPGKLWPILVPGWTLNYEMFFYGLFAVSLVTGRWFVIATMAALLAFGWVTEPTHYLLQFYTHPRMSGFLVGVLIGTWGPRLSKPVAVFAALAGIALVPTGGYTAVLGAGLVVWASLSAALENRLLLRLGDASYSIYLTHLITLGVLRTVWDRLGLPSVAYMLAGIVATSGVGWLAYRFAERPLMEALRARRAGGAKHPDSGPYDALLSEDRQRT